MVLARIFRSRVLAVTLGLTLAVLAVQVAAGPARRAQAAVGGPVILGGDDLTEHGFVDGAGNPQQGWLYIQRALENIKPQVTRTNDNSVAALGSVPSPSSCCDAGAAIGVAAPKAGLTVTYHDGAPAIEAFFAAVRGGTANPAIIWISGTDASNDLDSTESAALANNATTIGDFVNGGGGLMSHGVDYGWLSALLPGASTVLSGSDGDLYLTPEGQAAFPGLTNADINAGPWHNHFEGNLGGLDVLARSANVDDASGNDAPVIIGGSSVVLPGSISLDPPTATNPVGTTHTVVATVRNDQGAPAQGVVVTFSVISGPNAGDGGTGTTGADGMATFTYVGDGGPGTDTIRASFTDQDGTVQSAEATKTWVQTAKVDTKLVADPAIAQVFPTKVYFPRLTARLTVKSTGEPIPGKQIIFTVSTLRLGNRHTVCTAFTGEFGEASCSGVVLEVRVALGLGYRARFAGDATFNPSSDGAPLIRITSPPSASSQSSTRSSTGSGRTLTILEVIRAPHLRPEPGWDPEYIGQPS